MNLRITNNKLLHTSVILLVALISVGTAVAVGLVVYASFDSKGWGLFGVACAALIMAWPLLAGRRESIELKEYYDNLT